MPTPQSKRTLYVLYVVLAMVIAGGLWFAYDWQRRLDRNVSERMAEYYPLALAPQPGELVMLYNMAGDDIALIDSGTTIENGTVARFVRLEGERAAVEIDGAGHLVARETLRELGR